MGRKPDFAHRAMAIALSALTISFGLIALPAQAQDVGSYLLSKINEVRAAAGLNTLSINAQLNAAAQGHASYLASTPYAHPHRQRNGSLPQDRAAAVGYTGRVSENVVGGISATADWAFNWWMNSSVHHANLLSNWTEVGIGYADGGEYGKWFVVVFGNPNREPAPSEGHTGVNSAGSSTGVTGANNSGQAVSRPRPTQRPRPTDTPTITFTPSITYTPRATYTPTDTPTMRPASATPIVLEIVPPSGASPQMATPTPDLPPVEQPATPTPVAVAIAAAPGEPATPENRIDAESQGNQGNGLRSLIPWAIALQLLIIGGLALGAVIRRRR